MNTYFKRSILTAVSVVTILGATIAPCTRVSAADFANIAVDSRLVTPETTIADVQKQIKSSYAALPLNVQNAIISDGWLVNLTTNLNIMGYCFGHGVTNITPNATGLTDPNIKTVFLDANNLEGGWLLTHEMGHVMDHIYGEYTGMTFSDNPVFQQIYQEEGANMQYGKSSSDEFFAESFAYTLNYPNEMARQCPKAMTYVTAAINSIGVNGAMDNVVSRYSGVQAFPDTFSVNSKKADTGLTLDQIRDTNSTAYPFKQLLTNSNVLATF